VSALTECRVRTLSDDWKYDAGSIGYRGRVRDNQVPTDAVNLDN
jgi:hypothetical protein